MDWDQWKAALQPAEQAPAAVESDKTLAEHFEDNSRLALQALSEVLKLSLDPENPRYIANLRAVVAAATGQIAAQVRVDETAIKHREHNDKLKLILQDILTESERMKEAGEG